MFIYLNILTFTNFLLAQAVYQDIIYLKNSKEIRGLILNTSSEHVFIQPKGKQPIYIPILEIDKITSERQADSIPLQSMMPSQRWITHTEISRGNGIGVVSTQIGSFRNNVDAYQFRLSQNYLFKPHLQAGIGLGYDSYGNIKTLPIYGELRADLSETRLIPFFMSRIGYAWGQSPSHSRNIGGTMWQLGFGLKILLHHSKAFNILLSTHNQYFKWEYTNTQGLTVHNENVAYRFVSLGVGFSF